MSESVEIKRAGDAQVCACGCGGTATGSKSHFLPGHDQRLMGVLLAAHRAGQDVTVLSDGPARTMSPGKYAAEVFSERGLLKFELRMANPPKRARGTSAAQAAQVIAGDGKVNAVAEYLEPVKIQRGRWTYDALVTDRDQDGRPFEVRYTDKKGKEHTTVSFTLVD